MFVFLDSEFERSGSSVLDLGASPCVEQKCTPHVWRGNVHRQGHDLAFLLQMGGEGREGVGDALLTAMESWQRSMRSPDYAMPCKRAPLLAPPLERQIRARQFLYLSTYLQSIHLQVQISPCSTLYLYN